MVYSLFHTIDWILFLCLSVSTGYLLIFALLGAFRKKTPYTDMGHYHRIGILALDTHRFTEWIPLLNTWLQQDYPAEKWEIIIATPQHMELPPGFPAGKITVIQTEDSHSQANVLRTTLDLLPKEAYDLLLVMDTQTYAPTHLLAEINKSYNDSSATLQLHRVYAHRSSYPQLWNAIGEEIRRSIYSKGHNKIGLSAALEDSSFVLNYSWLSESLEELPENFTCRDVELLLLREREYIDYLDHLHLTSQKEINTAIFYRKQKQTFSQQYRRFFRSLLCLPEGIFRLNRDLIDRSLQWVILPPIWLLHLTGLMCMVTLYFQWMLSIKWWMLLFVLLFALALATPNYLVDKSFNNALKRVPFYIPGWFFSFFRKQTVK